MQIPSLYQLALRALVRNISTLNDVGDLDYDFCRPFLKKVDNPEQLHEIEQNCPQIARENDELWEAIIRKEITNYHKYSDELKAKGRKNWYKFYKYLLKAEAEAAQKSSQNLAQRLKRIEDERSAIETQIVPERIISTKRKRTAMARSYAPARPKPNNIMSTTRKPFTPAAVSVPHRVAISSDLIAQRKAAKEAQDMKKMPKILQKDSSRPSLKRKLSFDKDDLFGDSTALEASPKAKPQRKIALSRSKASPTRVQSSTNSTTSTPQKKPRPSAGIGDDNTNKLPAGKISRPISRVPQAPEETSHRDIRQPLSKPRKKPEVNVFMPRNQSRMKR